MSPRDIKRAERIERLMAAFFVVIVLAISAGLFE